MILFVGDKPSKVNIDPNWAFIGSRSGLVLYGWIERMGIKDDVAVINSVHPQFAHIAIMFHEAGAVVIALGINAAKALDKINVPKFSMPHPSGLNRKLNNKKYLDKCLTDCRVYIELYKRYSRHKQGALSLPPSFQTFRL
jgi:hypothetical protein